MPSHIIRGLGENRKTLSIFIIVIVIIFATPMSISNTLVVFLGHSIVWCIDDGLLVSLAIMDPTTSVGIALAIAREMRL
jgi:hypothetical protein